VRLAFDLGDRLADQALHLVGAGLHEIGGVLGHEAFELRQQQGLTRTRGDARQTRIGDIGRILPIILQPVGIVMRRLPDALEGTVEAEPDIDVARKFVRRGDDPVGIVMRRLPDALEGTVEAEPDIDVARKFVRRGDDRLQRLPDIGIAMFLTARERPGVATQERKMWCEILAERHSDRKLLKMGRSLWASTRNDATKSLAPLRRNPRLQDVPESLARVRNKHADLLFHRRAGLSARIKGSHLDPLPLYIWARQTKAFPPRSFEGTGR